MAIKHEKRREERGMEEVEEEVVEVRKRREEEAESRREQGEQTVEWKEVVVSRDFSLRIIFSFSFSDEEGGEGGGRADRPLGRGGAGKLNDHIDEDPKAEIFVC